MPNRAENIKICVLGQVGSGKSSLTLQFTQGQFPTSFDPTVEDVYEKEVQINNQLYRLHVLDTANQDDYSHMKDVQLKEADGFVIVYNVANNESFAAIGDSYRHIMRVHDNLPPTVLVANQTDLTQLRQVSTSEGEGISREFEFDQYFEVSSKNNLHVTESFMFITESIIARRQEKAAAALAASQDGFSERKPIILRSTSASPVDSELSTFNRKAFTLGTSFDRVSEDKELTPSPPVSVIPNRPIDLRALEAKHKRDQKLKKEMAKELKREEKAGTAAASIANITETYQQNDRVSIKAEKESSGGCCIIM